MLEALFEELYLKFRATYYRRMVQAIGVRKGSLSATEGFCVEIIYLLDQPTVTRFAAFLDISLPNALYKINSLVEKGYVTKQPSHADRRESRLVVTDKFLSYYGLKNEDNARLMSRIRETFSPEEIDGLEHTIRRIITLMNEREEDT